MRVEVNADAVQDLINEKFRGNVSWFADEIGVDKTYISAILKHEGKIDSYKTIVGIIAYCKKNNIDHERFIIFLQERLKKINQKEN